MRFRGYTFLGLVFFTLICVVSCDSNAVHYKIVVTNPSDLDRVSETMEIQLSDVPDLIESTYEDLVVLDGNDEVVLVQYMDMNQDSIIDRIIFQTDLKPHESKTFLLAIDENDTPKEEPTLRTFCRIVPERMDDFAWENDRVAFRSYGPECQRLYEQGIAGGLISSGIDAWTKRVDYPIINKWYQADRNGQSYHEDHGEGLDAYHVGTTRGCGGTAILYDENYVLSKNFTRWTVLANGPIRSVFELEYAPIEVGGQSVLEKKRMTLDLGSHLYRSGVSYTSKNSLDYAAIGLALHEGKGSVHQNLEEGWVSFWEPFGDSELGTGILLDPTVLYSVQVNDTLSTDESLNNIWAHVEVKNNTYDYWAGFGWKKSGYFKSQEEWEKYLKEEASKRRWPIQVKIIKD